MHRELLAFLVTQDFTKHIDLEALLNTKFEISEEENELDVKPVDLLKLLKIVLYQTAIVTKQCKKEVEILRGEMHKIKPHLSSLITTQDGRIDALVFKIDQQGSSLDGNIKTVDFNLAEVSKNVNLLQEVVSLNKLS